MSDPILRLQRLKEVTSLMADRALVPVAKAAERVATIEQHVEDLATHRNKLMRASSDHSIAATMLSQAERLHHSKAAALEELAKAKMSFEQQKAKAAKAVGRDLILAKLLEQQKRAARTEIDRRKLR